LPLVPSSRLALRPGLRVFRRDDTCLQVGIDDPRVVLPDTEAVRALLRVLGRGDSLRSLTPEAGLALARLVDAGLVVEHEDLVAASDDRMSHGLVALAAHGPAGRERVVARAACTVLVDSPAPWRAVAGERLASCGLAPAPAGVRPTVSLQIGAGEPPRSRTDVLVRDDRPHLVVSLYADRARLGPFVVPGSTACLRCVDAHLAERDPRRALILEQLEGTTTSPPIDPVLAEAAVALAVRELVTYAEGDRPTTWSATLTLGADLGQPPRSWSRHPHCGCSWA
jgi:hypothetical protein